MAHWQTATRNEQTPGDSECLAAAAPLVNQNSQLVIATHSPSLLAYPNARIYEFTAGGIIEVKYPDTDHFRVTRDFLLGPERMQRLLLSAEGEDLTSQEP